MCVLRGGEEGGCLSPGSTGVSFLISLDAILCLRGEFLVSVNIRVG